MKLAAALPKGDKNGLEGLDGILAAEPDFRHVVIAVLSTKELITDTDTGATIAKVRIDRIERVLAGDSEVVEKILRRSLEKRFGQATLPLELEDDISDIFRDALLDIYGESVTRHADGTLEITKPKAKGVDEPLVDPDENSDDA